MANSRRTASKRSRRCRGNGCAFLFVLSLVVVILFFVVFWVQSFRQELPKTPSFIASPLLSPLPSPQRDRQKSPAVIKATLAVAGDLLMHEPILTNSRQGDGIVLIWKLHPGGRRRPGIPMRVHLQSPARDWNRFGGISKAMKIFMRK